MSHESCWGGKTQSSSSSSLAPFLSGVFEMKNSAATYGSRLKAPYCHHVEAIRFVCHSAWAHRHADAQKPPFSSLNCECISLCKHTFTFVQHEACCQSHRQCHCVWITKIISIFCNNLVYAASKWRKDSKLVSDNSKSSFTLQSQNFTYW